jgi:hypothetical protein
MTFELYSYDKIYKEFSNYKNVLHIQSTTHTS